MAKTYTHSLVLKGLKERHDNGINLLIHLVHLAHATGERCAITDERGNIIAGIVTAEDMERLEGIESTSSQ